MNRTRIFAATALIATSMLTTPTAHATGGSTTTVMCVTDSMDGGKTTAVAPEAAASLKQRTRSYEGPCAAFGPAQDLGNGNLRSYTQTNQDGTPYAVGVTFTRDALAGLPTDMNDRHHCYDVNGDGRVDQDTECVGGYEHPLALPSATATAAPGLSSQWVLANYNPKGHGLPGIYDVPHFDFHFYLKPKSVRDAIRTGPCGLVINCDDYATATKEIPAPYMPAGYMDHKEAAEGAMGNHLMDADASPEWHGQPFTHTFMYGGWDGDLLFEEPMITKAWFTGLAAGTNADGCFPINQPAAWKNAGFYPRQYCINYEQGRDDFTVSLRDFYSAPGA
ncbi:DUF5602 domain-containing protein [Streptomyces sp. WM6378]|uniref:DUF5602 domain-containing protein n=1 Tax=Streptomyces sp. WM6378 TaxID=1415557 RepID=UPI0006AF7E0F|nr:DUF5602 domain-containing protein [Streptomyces sp. WM6378]KOU33013.1 hypothetical protein ADK54_42675 [Streptomyces sp. WM6378]